MVNTLYTLARIRKGTTGKLYYRARRALEFVEIAFGGTDVGSDEIIIQHTQKIVEKGIEETEIFTDFTDDEKEAIELLEVDKLE